MLRLVAEVLRANQLFRQNEFDLLKQERITGTRITARRTLLRSPRLPFAVTSNPFIPKATFVTCRPYDESIADLKAATLKRRKEVLLRLLRRLKMASLRWSERF